MRRATQATANPFNQEATMKITSKLTALLLSGTAIAILFTATALAPRQAAATEQFAKDTKLPCGQCHVSPGGGGALKPFGQQFKDNGNKLQ